MLNGILVIIFTALGIGLGLLYNKFVIKDYPDYKRKFGYFITVIVFLVLTLILVGIINIKISINSTIREYAIKLEQYIMDNFPDNEFVENGLDLNGINNNISEINNTVNELKTILPTNKELGVNKIIYDLIINYATKELQKKLIIVNYSVKKINSFSDENNILTVSSITSGLRLTAIKLVNTISLITSAIFILAFLVYIVYTLTIVKRERKFKNV